MSSYSIVLPCLRWGY